MLILKGFAVYEKAAAVVEVEGSGVPVWGTLRSGWAGPPWVVGLGGWHDRPSGLGWGNGMDLADGRCGGIEAGSSGTLRMRGGGGGCGEGSGCLWGVG